MANPVLTAAVLIEANGAALNNSGNEWARTDNVVSVKSIRVGRMRYPYISGQAWRRWWRETLYEDFDWKPSPVTRESKSAYTDGDPVNYADDDIFGYMAARKKETQRRVSPLKNSLLISVLPNVIEQDFGHFSRDLPASNSDPVPFEFEHYSTYLQGVFSLSLADSGRFEIGKMRDLAEKFASDKVTINDHPSANGVKVANLPAETRRERVFQCIEALSRLRHGANLTRNLSDVTPVAVMIGFLDGGNAPFQKLFSTTEDYSEVVVDIERLDSIMSAYSDRFLDVQSPVIFGALPGVVKNADKVKELPGIAYAGSSVEALKMAADSVKSGSWLNEIWR